MMCCASFTISAGSFISGISLKYSSSLRTSCAKRSVTPRSPLAHRLDKHRALARGQHHAGKARRRSRGSWRRGSRRTLPGRSAHAARCSTASLNTAASICPAGMKRSISMVRVFCGRGTSGAAFSSCSSCSASSSRSCSSSVSSSSFGARAARTADGQAAARRFCKRTVAGRRALAARLHRARGPRRAETVLADLVAARLVVRVHRLAGDGIDELVLQAVAGAAVHLPEGDPFRGRCRGIERDRAGDER